MPLDSGKTRLNDVNTYNRFFFHYFEEAKKEISGKIADYGRR